MAHWIRIHTELSGSSLDYMYVLLPSLSSLDSESILGGFDASVHISEEATNAAKAVPWAIVSAIAIAGVLGTGMCLVTLAFPLSDDYFQRSISPSLSAWVPILRV